MYDASAQGLREQVGTIVISAENLQVRWYKFSFAHRVPFSTYQGVVNNVATIKSNAKKNASAGESAYYNLAEKVSIMARNKKIEIPVYQIFVYNVVNKNLNIESYSICAGVQIFNKLFMELFEKNALHS